MELTLTTPGLLFPTISLLLLAYTNRFLAIASVIRNLHGRYVENPEGRILPQIANLRLRLRLIRDMQLMGVLSILLCVVCMGLIYNGSQREAHYTFVASMVLMTLSLALSTWEVWISTQAIELHLSNMEQVRLDREGARGENRETNRLS